MSEITPGQRLDLLAEIRVLLPDAEFSEKESWRGHDIEFKDSCGCYSEVTTESCSFYVSIVGTLPEYERAQYNLRQALEERIRRWANGSLTWSGCECCDNDLSVSTRLFQKKVEESK